MYSLGMFLNIKMRILKIELYFFNLFFNIIKYLKWFILFFNIGGRKIFMYSVLYVNDIFLM